MTSDTKKVEHTITKKIGTSHVFTNDMIRDTLDETGADINQILQGLLSVAASRSKVPVSGFSVGATVLCTKPDLEFGSIYLGANMEFLGLPLIFSVHAEQSAISNAWHHGETNITKLSVSYTPCGFCRQFMLEFPGFKHADILIRSDSENYQIHSIDNLIPEGFGPADLGVLESVLNHDRINFNKTDLFKSSHKIKKEAYSAANKSYAPYSKNYSGVCIKTEKGNYIQGRYIENAAYNPSITPMISALNIMNLKYPSESFQDISEIHMIEKKSSISQLPITELICGALNINVLKHQFLV